MPEVRRTDVAANGVEGCEQGATILGMPELSEVSGSDFVTTVTTTRLQQPGPQPSPADDNGVPCHFSGLAGHFVHE